MKDINLTNLTIKELVDGTQSCVHSDEQIHFRSNKYFHELIRRCIAERGLSSEAEFFERLAKDYFSRIGWMEKQKPKQPTFLSTSDLEMTEEQYNIQKRKNEFYKNQSVGRKQCQIN
jgi:hypothetical protein